MAIIIDNSKESSVTGEWSNPGKNLYGPIMEESNSKALLNEAYLVVGENYEESPSTELGYPHHVIKDGKLVIHKDGVQASWSRGSAEGNLTVAQINHIKKHYKELELDMSSFDKACGDDKKSRIFETKNINCEFKADSETMEIEGYGSVFGVLDSYRDIVMEGAFKRTINNNKKRMRFLWQHDMYEPIGKFIYMEEDTKGLYFKAKISDTDVGRKAYTLARDGVLNETSIGYNVIVDEYNKEKDIRYLKEVKLWEISLVTFAANEKATISSVKSFDYLLEEIKTGNILKYANEEKIKNAIKSLSALITNNDSPQGTHVVVNSPKIQVTKHEIDDICSQLLTKLKQ